LRPAGGGWLAVALLWQQMRPQLRQRANEPSLWSGEEARGLYP